MYKVFNQSKAIIITKNMKSENFSEPHFWIDADDDTDLKFHYQRLIVDPNVDTLIFNTKNSKTELFTRFASLFKNVAAAGGLIYDEYDRLLMIYRYHRWDLPKGRIEKGENARLAAIRESEEETGIRNIQVEDKLPCTYHMFNHFNDTILKTTFWYKMSALADQDLKPQLEEHIEKVCWMDKKQLNEALRNTYPSILELLKH